MRVATIDIGTNSVLLLVAERRGGKLVPVVERAEITRLGRGVDKTRALDPGAAEATLACLARYAGAIARAGASRVAAVGTSAMRDAQGGEGFRARAAAILGVEPRVISGDEEAALTFSGALAGLEAKGPVLVFDLGGGSTEIIRGDAGDGDSLERAVSLDVGAVRATERHVAHDPPTTTSSRPSARGARRARPDAGGPRAARRGRRRRGHGDDARGVRARRRPLRRRPRARRAARGRRRSAPRGRARPRVPRRAPRLPRSIRAAPTSSSPAPPWSARSSRGPAETSSSSRIAASAGASPCASAGLTERPARRALPLDRSGFRPHNVCTRPAGSPRLAPAEGPGAAGAARLRHSPASMRWARGALCRRHGAQPFYLTQLGVLTRVRAPGAKYPFFLRATSHAVFRAPAPRKINPRSSPVWPFARSHGPRRIGTAAGARVSDFGNARRSRRFPARQLRRAPELAGGLGGLASPESLSGRPGVDRVVRADLNSE